MESARRAEPSDLVRLAQLSAEMADELAEQRGGALWRAREARPGPFERVLADALGDADQLVLAGCVDAVVVGLATAELEALRDGRRLARLRELYVEPPARGVGVGTALMAKVLEWTEAQGCVGLDALVLPGSREAKNFFEAHGLVARAIVVHRPR